ncbi:MAG TPA: hypothetical protein VGC42_10670, partial [Kofleriaceae bacterium]
MPTLAWIPLLPLLGAAINLIFGRWLSKRTSSGIAILAVGAAFVLSAYMVFSDNQLFGLFEAGKGGTGITQQLLPFPWIEVGSFKAQLAFRLDTLSAVMILIVTFVGTLIHIYSTGYMA